MNKPIILIAEELSPATVQALGPDFEIKNIDGTNREELLREVVTAAAILIRSATRVDKEVLNAGKNLKVVARAGVGLDNVDVPAASANGVMVVNAPTSNIISAAELAIGLLLASARNISPADSALKRGEWKRSKYSGIELSEKTVGIVGFGRIGALVAQRLAGFNVKMITFDPYIQPAKALQLGVKSVSFDELLEQSDFITVHLPKTPETIGLIGEAALHKVKPTVHIVNAARGGIVDETALYEAIKAGRVAGAGLDVYAKEPCTDSPLFELDQVVATPHLGASTEEAQEKAGIAVAKSVRLALSGELVPDAVNVRGGSIAEEVRPLLPLAESLGRVVCGLADSAITHVKVTVFGELIDNDLEILELSALKGIFSQLVDEQVSYVNAPLIAKERGVKVELNKEIISPNFKNLVTIDITTTSGDFFSVAGTISGPNHIARVVGINGFTLDLGLSDHFVLFSYLDRPGIIGKVGAIMGEEEINIAAMQVARDRQGGNALLVLTVDSPVPNEVLEKITTSVSASYGRVVNLH